MKKFAAILSAVALVWGFGNTANADPAWNGDQPNAGRVFIVVTTDYAIDDIGTFPASNSGELVRTVFAKPAADTTITITMPYCEWGFSGRTIRFVNLGPGNLDVIPIDTQDINGLTDLPVVNETGQFNEYALTCYVDYADFDPEVQDSPTVTWLWST